jgi:DNA-directed RNA polymerase subunit RPC12/RpoP
MTLKEQIMKLQTYKMHEGEDTVYVERDDVLKALEQEPQIFEWCHDCREYDQEKHCCPRYNNVIRNTVEEMKQACEDAISREEAIGAVANLFEMSEYPHPYPQGKPIRLRDIKEKLKQLPPAQPKKIECVDAISREDALDALHMCLGTNSYDDDVTGDSYICYEEAEYEIEKLPSIQPKPIECEDAISRQAVLDVIAANCIWENEYNLTSSRIKKAVEGLPPVTPQPKTGHWIKITPSGIYMCSECEHNVLTGDIDAYHYCHHCGIKMIEPQESEET